ncbi:motile sperm domain-containing protein 2 [Galendromus occidentalis]|uniref:Motile sperm domain-containing protein 2 n=1 Tax=Galendromus occidentalis TaxID=34638 RepID=A0AAJ7SGT7_9ACAR|nr:motile sperm domain-containing protein 2 [Galendromus occidentalis]
MARSADDDPFGENEFVVTEEDVADFRKQVLEEVAVNAQLYHPKDVDTIKSNYEICRRYVRHKRRDITAAVEMAKKSLQWRNEFGVNDLGIEEKLSGISESNIYRLYLNVGCFIPFKKDREGSQCIIFRTRLHRKNAARSHDMKRFMIFWVEKLLYEQNNPRMTFIFDSTDASYSSMDLEQIMFTIQIFNEYYPWALGYVIVYNMPWILKTVWSGIRSLIPADGADRFKFCNGDDIFEYIDRDNLPDFMGGTVRMPFKELSPEEIEAIPVDNNIEKRICTTPAITRFYRENFGLFAGSADSGSHKRIFSCIPDSCLSFETINGNQIAYLNVTNCSTDGRTIAFRIRTNRREGYTALPHSGTIESQKAARISIIKLKEYLSTRSDKLLIQAVPVDHPQPQILDVFKKLDRSQVHEQKIFCEQPLDDADEADFAYSTSENGLQWSTRNANHFEERVALLTAQCERQQFINIIICALIVACLALSLHSKLCQSRDSWWCTL